MIADILDRPTGGDTWVYTAGQVADPIAAVLTLGGESEFVCSIPTGTAAAGTALDGLITTLCFGEGKAHRLLECLFLAMVKGVWPCRIKANDTCGLNALVNFTGEWTPVPQVVPGILPCENEEPLPATGFHELVRIIDWRPQRLRRHEERRGSPDRSVPAAAARLREISGLEYDRLAAIFGVTRATYHNWRSGSTPHGEHREHLLHVLALVEEAAKRLGDPSRVNTWLLSPLVPAGKRPLDLLAERRYEAFRGFLLRIETGHEVLRPLRGSSGVRREMSRDEFAEALRQLQPRPVIEDLLDSPESE